MRILSFLMALAISCNVAATSRAAEFIANVKPDGEYYTVGGEVITIWYDTLLLDDGTGQLVVSVAPSTIQSMKIDSRTMVTVTGKLKAGAFHPLVLYKNNTGENFEFTPTDMTSIYPPLNQGELNENNNRYRR